MRRWLLLVGLGMIPFSGLLAKEKEPVRFDATWSLHIGADGSVSDLKLITKLMPQLVAPIEAEIAKWKFRPGRIDGKPADTNTTLRVSMSSRDDGSGHARIHFDRAATGLTYETVTAPRYPVGALEGRREGLVLLHVDIDKQGNVVNAERDAASTATSVLLVEAAKRAVKEWKFRLEIVGGEPVAGGALIPICYSLQRYPGDTHRAKSCGWIDQDHARHDDDQMVALESVTTLETDISQRTL